MIKNITKQQVLATRIVYCDTVWSRARGLMFRKPITDEGWVFLGASGKIDLTNLFVFQYVDAVWLDEQNNVLQIRTMHPFELHIPGPTHAAVVIELPKGTCKATQTTVGDEISYTKQKGI